LVHVRLKRRTGRRLLPERELWYSTAVLLRALLILAIVTGCGDDEPACHDENCHEGAGGGGGAGSVTCDPGAAVFCRCPNGEDGSKECNDDGASFGECHLTSGEDCP